MRICLSDERFEQYDTFGLDAVFQAQVKRLDSMDHGKFQPQKRLGESFRPVCNRCGDPAVVCICTCEVSAHANFGQSL